ncbi:glycosyltransferase [Enorma phocaeensis]|uniref:glycosyltransferase n=1 Tax=Enorma phocaeensis TaxID=1871019 RepID=UPI003208EF82
MSTATENNDQLAQADSMQDPTGTDRAAPAATSRKTREPIEHLAIVVVTYKRQELLGHLFDSYAALTCAPWRIVVVDNENAPETRELVEQTAARLDELWGATEPDAEGGRSRMVYAPQTDNLGGAGGFSAGVRRAFELGAEWFWVMDDDVLVMPEAIERLARWTDRYQVVQGSRLDYDGGPFFWQYQQFTTLGIPNPLAKADLGPTGAKRMNSLCFEGGLFSREVVRRIGFPDPRFFIYGDDACYGYLASKVTETVVVSDVILQRSRVIANWEVSGVRQLSSTSDTNRFYIMRNRGFFARYLREHGDYHRILFGVGTAATLAKELIRLAVVDRTFKTGVRQLVRGMRAAREIYRDSSWTPMPPVA